MTISHLPPFLRLLSCTTTQPPQPFINSVFPHHHPLDVAHTLWWPTKRRGHPPTVVLLFIPGNPGLLDFYLPFLNALYQKDTTNTLAILALGHIGHSPVISAPQSIDACSLASQVESVARALDALKLEYGGTAKFALVGHSIGAWISLQVLKSRPADVSAIFLLFPTISNIANTPNGKRLSWAFSPTSISILLLLSRLVKYLPTYILCTIFRGWPLSQVLVLQRLLHSPSSIAAALNMAGEEMIAVQGLDLVLLEEHRQRLWFYYAGHDDWVGPEKNKLLSSFYPDEGSRRIVQDESKIPHAFCINHGDQLAEHCHQWLASSRAEMEGFMS